LFFAADSSPKAAVAGSFIHFVTPVTTASCCRASSLMGVPGSIEAPGGGGGRPLYGGAKWTGMYAVSGDVMQPLKVAHTTAK
ncbi:MAG: hypothetical protein ACHQK9_11655, partial [Reyranellales bacterium]